MVCEEVVLRSFESDRKGIPFQTIATRDLQSSLWLIKSKKLKFKHNSSFLALLCCDESTKLLISLKREINLSFHLCLEMF